MWLHYELGMLNTCSASFLIPRLEYLKLAYWSKECLSSGIWVYVYIFFYYLFFSNISADWR